MGRRIVQIVSLWIAAGLSVPLALALAEPPEATPPAATPSVPSGPKDFLQGLLKAKKGQQTKKKDNEDKPLPGPDSLAIPSAKAAVEAPAKAEAVPAPGAEDISLTRGEGERPAPPPPEKRPAVAPDSAAMPLPKMRRAGGVSDEPAPLPIGPGGAGDLPRPGIENGGALDAELQRSQAPTLGAGETNPLPPAVDRNTGRPTAPVAKPGAATEGLESFVLPADQLPLGKQTVGLTVEVVSPQFLNLNQEAGLKIIVKNNGSTDARGVVVRDELPNGLDFQSSQPIADKAPGSKLCVWRLGTVGAGAERIILLRIIPRTVGAFEHAATVSMQSGAKARTLVREPKLKVETTVSSAKVLKGQHVEWHIAVTNTGNGPAHRVIIRAKLSPGLRHESGEPNDENLFEQELEVLQPGQREVLEPLVTDAIMGGAQTCTVDVRSPDVTTALEEARSTVAVEVIEPKLAMTVVGPDKRFTDTIAHYDVHLSNPGTATARKIRVLATLPVNGRLLSIPTGAQFDKATHRLIWNLTQLDKDEKAMLSFEVRMSGAGQYQVAVESRADGGLHDETTKTTVVEGYADLDLEVTALRSRVIDVGDTAIFQIRIVNRGTKEATRILASGYLSKNLLAKDVDIENNGAVGWKPETGQVTFPVIARLGPNKETIINVRVQALPKPGLGTFRVELVHDGLKEGEGKLEDIGSLRVTPARTADK